MSIVVDFAWSKPSVAQLKSWGAVAAGMYVSHDVTKSASHAVVAEYAVAGIKSFLFFEDTADRAHLGYPAGLADATFAYATASAYGKPTWAPVIPACDFDVPDYAPNSADPKLKLGPVGEYYRAWHDVNAQLGVIADAAYGDFYVIQRLTAAGLCKLGVQTIAWSGGQVDLKDIVLYQNGQMVDSGQVDVEVIASAALLSHLAWIPGDASPAAVPKAATAYRHMVAAGNTLSLAALAAARHTVPAVITDVSRQHLNAQNLAVLNAYLALDAALTAAGQPHPAMPAGMVYWTVNP